MSTLKKEELQYKFGNAIHQLQDIDTRSRGTSEQVARLAEDATQTLEALQEIKQNQHMVEQKLNTLEKIQHGFEAGQYRIGMAAANAEYDSSEYKKLSRTCADYMRYAGNNTSLPQADAEKMSDYIVRANLKHADELTIQREIKQMTTSILRQGGFWVLPERARFIIDRIFETTPIRPYANIVNTTSDVLQVIIDDNEALDGGWVGEGEARVATGTPDIGLLDINVHEVYAQPYVSQKFLDDSAIDIERHLAEKVADKLSREQNTAFTVGDGNKKPRGFLTYPAATDPNVYQRGYIGYFPSSTVGLIDPDTLIEFNSLLKQAYTKNAVFFMNRTTFGVISQLKGSNGQYLLNLHELAQGADMVLFGKPVIFGDDIPQVASGANAIVLADFYKAYTIVDRFGIRVLRDDVTQKGFIKFYTTVRVGGDVTSWDGLKVYQIS